VSHAHPAAVVPPGAGVRAEIRHFTTVVKVGAVHTDGAYCVLEHTLDPGYVAMPLHSHRRESKTLYVLSGTLTVQHGDDVSRLTAGATVIVPPGTPYTFWNERPLAPSERDGRAPGEVARFLGIAAPAGLESYYQAVAEHIPAKGPPDVEAILAVSGDYGIEVDMHSLLDIVERYGVALA
jgi:mannose-6-phosphate isomerase-like protein (cupin superfamily)